MGKRGREVQEVGWVKRRNREEGEGTDRRGRGMEGSGIERKRGRDGDRGRKGERRKQK